MPFFIRNSHKHVVHFPRRLILVLVTLVLVLVPAWRSYGTGFSTMSFWQLSEPYMQFTATSSSVFVSNCSGPITIQASLGTGAADVVVSDLSVTLGITGGAMTLYSDAACLNVISSPLTILSGSSSVTFYFIPSTAGVNIDMNATAAGYKSSVSTVATATNPYVWTGGGANADWTTAANWSGGARPLNASHIALLDATCSINCSPNLNVNINLGGVRIDAGFTGTINQGSVQIILGAWGWVQRAGTFAGGTNSKNVSGPFRLTSGSYTATTSTTTNTHASGFIQSGGTFNGSSGTMNLNNGMIISGGVHNATSGILTATRGFSIAGPGNWSAGTGTLSLASPINTPSNLDLASTSFHHLEIRSAGSKTITNGNVTVAGDLTFNGSGPISGGVFEVSGNLSVVGEGVGADTGAGRPIVRLVGAAPTITGSGSGAKLPSIEIDTTGAVTLSGTFKIDGDYTVTAAGSFDAGTSTMWIGGGGAFATDAAWNFGSESYNNIVFNLAVNRTYTLTGTIKANSITGNNGCCSIGVLNGGAVEATGSITKFATNFHLPDGSANYSMIGTGAANLGFAAQDTRIWGTTFTVNKTGGGSVTMVGDVTMNGAGQNFNLVSGSFTMNGRSLNLTALTLNGNTLNTGGGLLRVGGVTYAASPGSYPIFGGTVNNP